MSCPKSWVCPFWSSMEIPGYVFFLFLQILVWVGTSQSVDKRSYHSGIFSRDMIGITYQGVKLLWWQHVKSFGIYTWQGLAWFWCEWLVRSHRRAFPLSYMLLHCRTDDIVVGVVILWERYRSSLLVCRHMDTPADFFYIHFFCFRFTDLFARAIGIYNTRMEPLSIHSFQIRGIVLSLCYFLSVGGKEFSFISVSIFSHLRQM